MDSESFQPAEVEPTQDFHTLVLDLLKKADPIDPKGAYGYLPEAARFYYPVRPLPEAIKDVPLDEDFFAAIVDHFKDDITPEQFTTLIMNLNQQLQDKHVRIILASDREKTESVLIDGNSHYNPLKPGDYGQHLSFGYHIIDVEEDTENPAKINFWYTVRYDDTTSLLFLNEDTAQTDPSMCLVTLAHEMGHEVESKQAKQMHIDNLDVHAAPATEVVSTVYGYELSRRMHEKTGNPKFVEGGMRNLRLYNQVIYGNIQGAE